MVFSERRVVKPLPIAPVTSLRGLGAQECARHTTKNSALCRSRLFRHRILW